MLDSRLAPWLRKGVGLLLGWRVGWRGTELGMPVLRGGELSLLGTTVSEDLLLLKKPLLDSRLGSWLLRIFIDFHYVLDFLTIRIDCRRLSKIFK